MKNYIKFLILLSAWNGGAQANNIQITNLSIPTQNTTFHYSMIQFDLTWDGSWRTSTLESNWDAAWIFCKWRKKGSLVWNHCSLATSGHQAATGSTIDTPTDGKGVFVYKDAVGIGSNSFTQTKLRWNYGSDGLVDNDLVEVCVYGIEMVYIPQGSFYVGDGTATGPNTYGQFETGTFGIPYQITSESRPATLGGGSISSMGNNNGQGMDPAGQDDFNDAVSQTLPLAFPKGYNAFYIMKYETTQEQYVQFLNKLTYDQQRRRTQHLPNSVVGTAALTASYRNGIVISSPGTNNTIPAQYACDLNGNLTWNEADDGQNIACNWLHFADCEAYMDWAGLRPITELEYEKACRGTVFPVIGEYAWGNTTITNVVSTNVTNSGRTDEVPNTGNCTYGGIYNGIQGPIRVGAFSSSASNRQQSGGSYYGVMDLTGNVREMVITVGNATGRAFTGISGDGVLAANGESNVTNWPSGFQADISNAVGAGYKGNDWGDPSATYMTVSGRNGAAYNYKWRDPDYGFRGGRIAP